MSDLYEECPLCKDGWVYPDDKEPFKCILCKPVRVVKTGLSMAQLRKLMDFWNKKHPSRIQINESEISIGLENLVTAIATDLMTVTGLNDQEIKCIRLELKAWNEDHTDEIGMGGMNEACIKKKLTTHLERIFE